MLSAAKLHDFKEKSFQGPAYCDYCEKFLWGLARQGVQCTECHYQCHQDCSEKVVQCRPQRRSRLDSLSATDSEAESFSVASPRSIDFNEPLHSPKVNQVSPAGVSTSSSIDPAKAYRKSLQQNVQKALLLHHNPTTSAVGGTGLVSPKATAKAFTRVVARSSVLFGALQMAHDIYTWRRTFVSLVCLMAWVLICIYPASLACMPLLAFLLLLGRTGLQLTPASTALLPRYDETRPEYLHNLERTQQMMLSFIQLHDRLSFHLQHVYLGKATCTALLIGSLLGSALLWHKGGWIIMGGGLAVLLNKTWIGTVIESLVLFVFELLQTVVDLITLRRWRASKPVIEVSVYENQRWWAQSASYTSQLLRSEGPPWSNITGKEPALSKEEMPPPANYIWEDDTWQLDRTGPWVDDLLGIVELIECDDDGWLYTDHKWKHPRNRQAMTNSMDSTLTRRRRWFRKARPSDGKAKLV